MSSKNKCSFTKRGISIAVGAACLVSIPIQTVHATSSIASRVESFCAPSPTVPDVTSCSACHSTTNNRGINDLTAAGVWALNGQDSNFCPGATTTPPPATAPAPAPAPTTPGTGMGRGSRSEGSSMGRGSGGSADDDDDDGDKDD